MKVNEGKILKYDLPSPIYWFSSDDPYYEYLSLIRFPCIYGLRFSSALNYKGLSAKSDSRNIGVMWSLAFDKQLFLLKRRTFFVFCILTSWFVRKNHNEYVP